MWRGVEGVLEGGGVGRRWGSTSIQCGRVWRGGRGAGTYCIPGTYCLLRFLRESPTPEPPIPTVPPSPPHPPPFAGVGGEQVHVRGRGRPRRCLGPGSLGWGRGAPGGAHAVRRQYRRRGARGAAGGAGLGRRGAGRAVRRGAVAAAGVGGWLRSGAVLWVRRGCLQGPWQLWVRGPVRICGTYGCVVRMLCGCVNG